MKAVLNKLFEHKTLEAFEAKEILTNIASGQYNHSQIASFLSVFLMRSITVAELSGFTEAMLELSVKIDFSDYDFIDIVGTGGDGKDTFNISTLACFVVAGAGIKVIKHGNYGVSSISGSSNVMEYLGYTFTNDSGKLKAQVEKAGICFLHAPLFHPAMKTVAPVRKDLGIRTFFNILGPLVNPALPKYQLLGVYNLELGRLYNYYLQSQKENYFIVHSLDGYDEISLTDSYKVYSKNLERIITPEELGLEKCLQSDLSGGVSVKEAGDIFINILSGKGTAPQVNAVIANAAYAVSCVTGKKLNDSILTARESIESGRALQCFKQLISLN